MERNKKIVWGVVFLVVIIGMVVAAVIGYPLFYGTGHGLALPNVTGINNSNNPASPNSSASNSSLGSTIIFSGSKADAPNVVDVYTYSPDGRITNLTSSSLIGFKGGAYAALSPDHKKIVYITYRGSDGVVATMGIDGSDKKAISQMSGIKYFPSWSPDGQKILYKNGVWGNNTPIGPQGKINLVQVDLQNGTESTLSVPYQAINYPAWLPDGQGYSFVSTDYTAASNSASNHIISFKNRNYSEVKPNAGVILAGSVSFVEFSPDMKMIAFVNSEDNQLYVMNSDGSDVKELTSSSSGLVYNCPNWSDDSSFLLAGVNDMASRQSSIIKVAVSNGASSKLLINGFVNITCPRIGRH